MEERKLASIQKIVKVQEIKGYDRVVLVTVLGWNCIAKKGDFKVGDLVVYFEPDSRVYPHVLWDSFLSKSKYRIKTIKMCKTTSQGLVLPLNIIETLNPKAKYKKEEGTDLTEILNVEHYDKPKVPIVAKKKHGKLVTYLLKFYIFRALYRKFLTIFMGTKLKGQFPVELMSKTSETNIQNIPNFFKQNKNHDFYFSEKLEGQCGNYFYYPLGGIINKLTKKNGSLKYLGFV